MFESIINFFKKIGKPEKEQIKSKDAAKERLHLVLMQDRANVSADFLDLMKQEIIEVIKKYIDIDENAIDVRLTNKTNGDGTTGAPALYANIPIVSMKDEVKSEITRDQKREKAIVDNKKVKKTVKKQEEKTELENTTIDTEHTISNLEDKNEKETVDKATETAEKKSELKNENLEPEDTINNEEENEKTTKNVDIELSEEKIELENKTVEDTITDTEVKPKRGRKKVTKNIETQSAEETNK